MLCGRRPDSKEAIPVDNPAARVAEGSLGEVTQLGEALEHPKIGVKIETDSRHGENY